MKHSELQQLENLLTRFRMEQKDAGDKTLAGCRSDEFGALYSTELELSTSRIDYVLTWVRAVKLGMEAVLGTPMSPDDYIQGREIRTQNCETP